MKTKKEVIDFLESKVGGGVKCIGNPALDSQCVTLIKSLMDFLGVKDPYKARGHAETVITAYLSEGIADKGIGFLSVFSNENMGASYGHIWCNAGDGDGVFYESNGAKPLIVTRGKTYSYDSVCNFDKYIKGSQPESNMMQIEEAKFSELVTKSTKYDEFVKAGYQSAEQVNVKVTELSSKLGDYDKEVKQLKGDLSVCKAQIEEISENQEMEATNEYVEAQEILATMLPNGGRKTTFSDGGEEIEISYKLKVKEL